MLMHLSLLDNVLGSYSKTSEQRTHWDRPLVPCREVVLFLEVLFLIIKFLKGKKIII